ncbi:MAG: hypothetical protein Q4B17_14670, partial [Lautropia sp.]|nr:hypothetical protein [Lautropia sp.]
WLQGVGNAVLRAQRGFPFGLAPKPHADGVATLAKASSLGGAWRLVSPQFWGQRGDESVHNTL